MEVPTLEQFKALEKKVADLHERIEHFSLAHLSVDWVPADIAEAILNCSRTTLWRLTRNGRVQIRKRGRSARFSLSSIRTYLLSKHQSPTIVDAKINSLFLV